MTANLTTSAVGGKGAVGVVSLVQGALSLTVGLVRTLSVSVTISSYTSSLVVASFAVNLSFTVREVSGLQLLVASFALDTKTQKQ